MFYLKINYDLLDVVISTTTKKLSLKMLINKDEFKFQIISFSQRFSIECLMKNFKFK